MWRGRLPHWRADDVRYYVTFRHRRELDEAERRVVYKQLTRPEGKRWDLVILCVLADRSELIFTVREGRDGRPFELSDVVEQAKRKAGAVIIKNTGERFPPFYTESYDRIIRDEAELEERFNEILESSVKAELAEDPEEYATLYVADAP
jgi:hypothetical protein